MQQDYLVYLQCVTRPVYSRHTTVTWHAIDMAWVDG